MPLLRASVVDLHIAAIDDDILASYITGVLRAQEGDERADFLRPAEAVGGDALHERLHEILELHARVARAFLEEGGVILARVDEAGRHGVDGDAMGAKLVGEAAAEA